MISLRYGFVSLPLWWGRLVIKPRREPQLFSERYRLVPMVDIGPLRIVWRRYH